MDNKIQVFKNNELGNIRTIEKYGDPWFVAKDVADILGYAETNRMTVRLDDDEKMSTKLVGISKTNPVATLINESGLYSAIMGSQKPEAKKFKKWVTSEVLPALRKHGGFVANTAMFVDSYFPEMGEGAREMLIDSLDAKKKLLQENKRLMGLKLGLEADNNRLVEKNMVLIPKGDFYDAVAGSVNALEMSKVAKVLNFKNIGRTKLFKFLRDNDVLMYNNVPYQRHIDLGHFRTIEQKFTTTSSEVCISIKTLVYQKGVDYIRKLLLKAGYEQEVK